MARNEEEREENNHFHGHKGARQLGAQVCIGVGRNQCVTGVASLILLEEDLSYWNWDQEETTYAG